MSRYTDQKSEIKSQLLAVAGIGNVYDSPKNPVDEASLKSFFAKGSVINTVQFSRVDGTDVADTAEDNEVLDTAKTDNWSIVFFYSFKDDQNTPSEYAFQELVDRIEDQFRFLQNLNGKAERSYPLNRTSSGMWAMVGGTVLCHRAEWRLPVESRIYNGQ